MSNSSPRLGQRRQSSGLSLIVSHEQLSLSYIPCVQQTRSKNAHNAWKHRQKSLDFTSFYSPWRKSVSALTARLKAGHACKCPNRGGQEVQLGPVCSRLYVSDYIRKTHPHLFSNLGNVRRDEWGSSSCLASLAGLLPSISHCFRAFSCARCSRAARTRGDSCASSTHCFIKSCLSRSCALALFSGSTLRAK